MMILFLLISFAASVIGAICGLGGGIIIKPVLDMLGLASVSAISFMSGCTVLSMSGYSVAKNLMSKENTIQLKTATPLAVGAVGGGIAGNALFHIVKAQFANADTVGAVQAACLTIITIGALLYTLFKSRVHTRQVKNTAVCVLIGLVLGVVSSFLGIGGGPINLVVLFYFFSMDTKAAVQNSLYIILFSQAANLIAAVVGGNIPPFPLPALCLMIAGGIGGGAVGRAVNKRLNEKQVNILFVSLMVFVICICCVNFFRFSSL